MSIQATKVAAAGIAGAGGSGGAVYGTYYLVTKEKGVENTSQNSIQKANTESDYAKLKEWMTTSKCTITKIHLNPKPAGDTSTTNPIDLSKEPVSDGDKSIIGKLLTWLNPSTTDKKSAIGCTTDASASVEVKTTDSGSTFTQKTEG